MNDTLDEMDLIDICRTFHPNAEEYTFFSREHGTFSRIAHILGHTSNLSKFKKIVIISSIFSDHNSMSSVQFSHSVMSDYLQPVNCSTPSLPVHHQLPESTQTHVHWVGDAIQPSHPVIPFSSCSQSFPASGSFQMSQLFTSGGQSIGVSASPSVFPMNTQGWYPWGWTGWISLQSKGLSQESSPTPQFKSKNSLALNFLYSPTLTSIHDHWKYHSLD